MNFEAFCIFFVNFAGLPEFLGSATALKFSAVAEPRNSIETFRFKDEDNYDYKI